MKRNLIILALAFCCYSSQQVITAPVHSHLSATFPVAKDSIPGPASPAVQKEFAALGIPLQVPNKQYPDWQSFHRLLDAKKNALSLEGIAHSANLLLNGYQLYRQPATPAMQTVIEEQTDILVTAFSEQYKLLYQCLLWMKNNRAPIKELQKRILAYAYREVEPPVIDAGDPAIISKEELQAERDRFIMNRNYLEKIKEL